MKNSLASYFLLALGIWLSTINTQAQDNISDSQGQPSTISGVIKEFGRDKKTNLITGASIYWLENQQGTYSDEAGKFSLERLPENQKLIIAYLGYKNDTLLIGDRKEVEILLVGENLLDEVVLTAHSESTIISSLNTIKVEKITTRELLKAACCNLSESFETNPSVDVNFSDAITGAKTLKMLGLDGVYSQILKENLPLIRGLGTRFGLESIPGPWLRSIQLSKGAGSVVNGYESISGQINLDLKRPYDMERSYFDLFGDSDGRIEANILQRFIINEKLASSLMGHTTWKKWRRDMNDDGWTDNPAKEQWNIMNRWEYQGRKFEGQWGAWYYNEERLAGQQSYTSGQEQGPNLPYGINMKSQRAEAYSKTGYVFDKTASIGLQLSGSYYDQEFSFGIRDYNGSQKSMYANLIYQKSYGADMLGTTEHVLKIGASYYFDQFEENFMSTELNRIRNVPGVFTEYAYNPNPRFSMIAGLRTDYHSAFKTIFSPRLHLKYAFSENFNFRASASKGYREANIYSEQPMLWVSAKTLDFNPQQLAKEAAWNFGANFLYKTEWHKKLPLTFTIDLYRTQFTDQMLFDTYHSNDTIHVYALDGLSFSNYGQAQVDIEIINGLELRLAGKAEIVKQTYKYNGLQYKPLTPYYTGLFNTGWTSKKKNWLVDFTVQYKGPQAMNKSLNGANSPEEAPDYAVLNSQITYKWKNFDFYVGGENLTNYMMHHPIEYANDPYHKNFNAGNVWGPIAGRLVYSGIRWRASEKKSKD